MSKLAWDRLANGDLLCRQYPIRLVKPYSRRAEDPGWLVRTPYAEDPTYDEIDGWQWGFVLDRGSAPLEAVSKQKAIDMINSSVYLAYVREHWIPDGYGEWDQVRRDLIRVDAAANAARLATWLRDQSPATTGTRSRYSRADLIAGPLSTSEAIEALAALRDAAAERRDLQEALLLDNRLEDNAMHADDRRTCHPCQDWADHRHHPLTGVRVEGGQTRSPGTPHQGAIQEDPYQALGLRGPNAHGWPALLELSSVQFAALFAVTGAVTAEDRSEHAQPLREIHRQLTNLSTQKP
ncbi:hypothetical protein ACIA49_39165 [Kribbella sp. NPDC051587]|uniref:hypothetical protein n=1 Tax=Kribbella sp. NPDC051587 TaxID=3364119 RepID=UPI0037B04D4D